MLSEAEVERYARQVIVPEIGARGQARLLAARVAVLGAGPLAARTADLLRRAGTGVIDEARGADAAVLLGPCDVPAAATAVPVVLADLAGARATLVVLPRGCCATCAPAASPPSVPETADALAVCAAHALAALAATETLLALLDATRTPRRYTLDVGTGSFRAEPLPPPVCRHGGVSA